MDVVIENLLKFGIPEGLDPKIAWNSIGFIVFPAGIPRGWVTKG